MRLALVHPVYWPEVHRGTERIVNDLGRVLAGRGHDVTLITSHPRPARTSHEDGIRVVRCRRPPRAPGMGLHELFLETVPEAAWRLRSGGYDVAGAFHLSSACAATVARRRGGPPFVHSFHGIPTRTYLIARRRRLEMLERTLAAAAVATVLSEAAARDFRRHLFVDPEVVPAGVDVAAYRPGAKAPAPTLLCPATFTDPRKRVALLLEAFAELRADHPDARLVLADNPDPSIGGRRPELPVGVEWADLNAPGALPAAYSRAWLTVLPSVEEAQGMVLLESLAAGTPFVAARSGAPPEIHGGRDEIGRTFEPDDLSGLVRAMAEALPLAASDGTAAACRERAADYSWARLAGPHEDLYRRAASHS